jgi:amphiphysin
MNTMHRQIGKLRKKGPGDNANVSVLLSDYDDADKMLAKVGYTVHGLTEVFLLILDIS